MRKRRKKRPIITTNRGGRSIITTNVRLDRSLHLLLKSAAQDAERSLNGEINARLRSSLDPTTGSVPAPA